MTNFTAIGTVKTIKRKEITINIVKYQKNNTSSVFFAPEIDGKRLTRTLWARKYDAIATAGRYIELKTT